MRPDRKLPDGRRGEFKERFGRMLGEDELGGLEDDNKPLITVGDVVSLTMRRHGIAPFLSVYDGMTERREMTEFARLVEDEGWEEQVVRNPAGMITGELFAAVENALSGSPGIIRVVGEEDLAVIPCIFLAPEGSKIVYGWPGEGMMVLTTDAASRRRAEELYQMMEESE
jgi:GTP-dependent dephospho-CoA kinase